MARALVSLSPRSVVDGGSGGHALYPAIRFSDEEEIVVGVLREVFLEKLVQKAR